jgi:hypothetical protein
MKLNIEDAAAAAVLAAVTVAIAAAAEPREDDIHELTALECREMRAMYQAVALFGDKRIGQHTVCEYGRQS